MKFDHPDSTITQKINTLVEQRPQFHGCEGDKNWRINNNILNWLTKNVKSGMATLETGAGYSTVVFALCGASHTAISPADWEHKRITNWCQEHDIDTNHLRFIAEASEFILPKLEIPPLDIVLIDGRHAFPSPFIDWYYAAAQLKVGGRIIVDDTFIHACKILNEFLLADKDHWKCEIKYTTATVFQKISDDIHSAGWRKQPWGSKKRYSLKAKATMFKNRTKNNVYKLLGIRK